ncbi:hypothetical protein FIV31_03500 [Coxiella endosymbiont of Ornithodoros amblus]|uniref:hypothetical protein n=1 Tax=Coxiella endosymbiont of Ornithodoros amblus TaxID=1656166 RepID=UPI00244DCE49|nr:hypothetical protein [Coxiella endosymbiont of Ornithodoros amblus]MBW5802643.1 hypothetical protein [Coxiella endosymbiont of Ornithodoros amblus]
MFIERNALKFLDEWLTEKQRKPLIIPGACQVGKTALFGGLRFSKKRLIELNFEQVIPIEIKSASTSILQSLHVLMAQKQLDRSVPINGNLPTQVRVNTKTPTGKRLNYQLSLPFHLISQLQHLFGKDV